MLKKFALGGLTALLIAVTFASVASAAVTTTVSPTTMNGWFFYNDETDVIDNTLGSFVTGPGTPPMGTGSAQMTVSGTQRKNIATYQFKDVQLSDIGAMSFATYSQSLGDGSPGTERAPYLQFNVDFNNTDTWQKRLVYVPAVNGVVTADTWQTWNATGTALWTWSGYAANGNQWPDGNTSEYRTWSAIVAAFPNAETRSTDSWLGIRVGEPYANGFTGNVDNFSIVINGDSHVFNFEATAADSMAPAVPMHVSPANGATTTTASLTKVDWTDVTDATSTPVSYFYQSSYGTSTNVDGSFTSPAYTSGALSVSEIGTAGTPEGTYYWHVRAADSVGNSSAWSSYWKFVVSNATTTTGTSTAPMLSNVPASPVSIPELSAYSFDANASDADMPAQTLTFSLSGAPAGASINASTGVFTWTPTEAQGPGSYTFTVMVSDGSLTDSESLTINVTEVTDPAPTEPTTKDDCKNGGWKSFTNPSFKNQGQCVSSVASGR